ncbi:Early nodulin-like protein 1 [Acorus gramineus]|uniref:Early nodulin-like protein 1 n=1 Tax=Acorus gramineus TaxID=55184 RepID=A0AAV9B0M9_ACOGR|nr:Early nodulin-like protein 1 [Acorus gramineus]
MPNLQTFLTLLRSLLHCPIRAHLKSTMASSTVFTSAPLFLALIFITTISSEAKDFLVGGTTNAWKIPTSKTDSLNSWAEGTRFQIGDSLVWKYEAKKDSVVEVTREAYLSCNATDPISQNDEGNTTVRFERSGAFYFISGEKGHCQKGQKLIVVVLSRKSGGSASSSPSPAPMGSFDGPAIAPASGDARRIGGSSHVVGALVVLGGLVGMVRNLGYSGPSPQASWGSGFYPAGQPSPACRCFGSE